MKPTKTTSSFTRKKMMASEPANGNSLPSVILGSSSTVGTSSASKSMSSLALREQQHHQNVEGVKERKERQMRRLAAEMDDQRSKFERDKAEALSHQKEAMNRAFRVQLAKLLKEKEELQRKCQTLMQQSKEPNGKIQSNGMTTAASHAAAETMKLIHENTILRNEKKKQEEQLQMMRESEQHRFENMRSLLDDKARELITFQKQLRQQIARLREESKTKDRVISHLESELRMQTGRAQQFRDILEQSLLTANRCSISGQQNNHNERDELIASERKLQVLVDDLRETMRHQQDTFAHEKKELLRRLSETERQQGSLRQKNKQVLTRNVHLTVKSQDLAETIKSLKQVQQSAGAMSTTPDTTNLKRSLTRPNVNQLGSPSKNDKQRRMEYVQQIQKLRKEQRYYSMWELPPLLEVDTDGLGSDGNVDSDGSLSPAATSGVTSCSSDSAWSEDTRRELEVLFSQLSREHSDLQRNYQLLHEKLRQLTCFSDADAANVNYATLQADYNAARARIRDLEEILQLKNSRERETSDGVNAGRPTVVPSLLEIQAKFLREKHIQQTQMAILVKRLEEAKERHQSVQAELSEARDQNELLEFRILELEEMQERAPSQCSTDQRDRKDVCTDTDSDDVSVGDSGITSLASLMVECPSPVLPRSPCSSGSSLDSDYLGEKISSVKAELQLMVSSLNDPSQKSVLAQLQALLGVCQSRLAHKSPNTSETCTTNWDWQLQESGIFEEDHHSYIDGSTQTDVVQCEQQNGDVSIRVTVPLPLCGRVMEDKEVQLDSIDMDHKFVQAVANVQEFATQTDPIINDLFNGEKKMYRDQTVQSLEQRQDVMEGFCQTEGEIMTLAEFRDVESYYVQQIEILQKEKASHRKKFQASRDETSKSVQQLELLGRQFQERERQFEEILQKNCRAFERELEMARELNSNELCTLKECLQLVWHEVKDYANVNDMPKTSVMEFTQALISSLHGICSELGQLRVRVVDLAEMEQAFQTTLRQADGLVHSMEEKHLQRIRELELTEKQLRSQLKQHIDRHLDDDMDGSLEIKIQELEQEKDALSLQVGKCQELEDYCQQLHGRLEEYEHRERSFHQAVQDAERRFSSREQRYREEIQLMQAELEKCRENEATWRQRLEHRDGQLGLMRNELETEQKTIASLELEVKELQSKLDKDDTSFRNEVTKLRSQLTTSLAQLNELESLNCQLREKIVEYQNTIYSLQRSLDEKNCQNGTLAAENSRLAQAQMEMMSMSMVALGKPLTEELLEIESDEGCMSSDPVVVADAVAASLDDFQEISLPTTPTVVDGCNNVFEEHFKVLESLENYLESQHLIGATVEDNDESGISTSPSIHENENFALLEAQLAQLRTEKHFLLNSVVNSQKKDEVIQILIDQLKYNAPRQYLIETAAHIRKIATNGDCETSQHRTDKDIDRVCSMLEAPIDLADVTTEGCSLIPQQPSASPNCNYDAVIPHNKVARRQTTITVLPEEDPLLSPPSDLKITRKVGKDGLVIAWLPSPDPECVGYLICVNGQEAHRGRNAQRTKAVLSGLDLHSEMDICIYSLSIDGLVSSPTTTLYLPDERLAVPDVANHHGHAGGSESAEPTQTVEASSPREVVVQTFYTNSSVTVRSSRRVIAPVAHASRLPVRPTCLP